MSATRFEPGRGAPDLDQDLLAHLLALRRVANHPAYDPEHLGTDPVEQLREGIVIPTGHRQQEDIEGDRGIRGVRGLGRRRSWPVSPRREGRIRRSGAIGSCYYRGLARWAGVSR